MHKIIRALAVIGTIGLTTTAANAAQTGEELHGQIVDVRFADGTTNSVFFGADGRAQINGADGQAVAANWFLGNDQICLQTASMGECWGYAQRFEAGQSYSLSSTCNEASQWTPRAVNPVRQEVAPAILGERG